MPGLLFVPLIVAATMGVAQPTSVTCLDGNLGAEAELVLRITGQNGPGPGRSDVELTSADGHVCRIAAGEVTTVRAAAGSYVLSVTARQFVDHRERISVTEGRSEIVVRLRPHRTITGIVIDRESGAAVAGARITTNTSVETITARTGRFTLDVDPERWPRQIVIRTGGYGNRTIELPKARADTSLDEIALDPGAAVTAEIHQTQAGQVVEVELIKLTAKGRVPGGIVDKIVLPPSDEADRSARFENVGSGEYVVVVKGVEASQRAGERVVVGAGDALPVHIQLTPFRLRLRATRRGESLASRAILRSLDGFWETPLAMGSGESAVTLWQGGKITATVESPGNAPYRARRTFADGVDTTWDLEMPRAELTGKVVDANTGTPIADAAVALEMESTRERYQLSVSTRAGTDGRFRFEPVLAGRHKVKAAAAGYPASETALSFDESEESREITIALTRQPMTMVEVKDARGMPVANADVFVFRSGASVDFGRTDPSGHRPIFVPEREARELFVVPRDGSLAIARATSGQPELAIVVPDGSSRIVIRAESETHDPIPAMAVDVRYNGVLLPFEVMAAFAGRGSRTHSDADGRILLNHMPAGVYEFTPVAKAAKPVRMSAMPGENVAVMTFARVAH